MLWLDISGFGLVIRGLPADLSRELAQRWKPFVTGVHPAPVLELEVGVGGDPPASRFDPKRMASRRRDDGLHFEMPEGRAALPPAGPAALTLAPADLSTRLYALINLTTACLAWRLLPAGGLLLHAAGIVLDERAFLLVGPPGSGKSTWAALAGDAGAQILSDDLILVDASGARPVALRSPFRPAAPEAPCGRWPIGAILIPEHGPAPRLEEVTPRQSRARLLANLPFVSDLVAEDPAPMHAVERLRGASRVRRLTFAKDASFVTLLERFSSDPA